MEQKRDTFTLAALMRWLVECNKNDPYICLHPDEVLVKIADIESAYKLDMSELIEPCGKTLDEDEAWKEVLANLDKEVEE